MRTKQIVPGLNNSQKFRAIVNGVGFIMKVQDLSDKFVFSSQRASVWLALEYCATQKVEGFGKTYTYYDDKMKATSMDVQVNLL